MAKITEAFVEITARTGKLAAGLRKSTALTQRAAKAMTRVLAPLAAGLSLAGAISGVVKLSQKIDELAKKASRLGILTENLESLRFAAGLAGAEARTLDMSIQRMTRRVSEAAKGTGEAKGAIAELGLDPVELAKLSPDRMLKRVADAIKDVRQESDQLRLAFKLFDSEGAGLLPLLRQGSAGIAAAQAKARFLGRGGTTGEDAAVFEQINDSVASLRLSVEALVREVLVNFGPAITKMVDHLALMARLAPSSLSELRSLAKLYGGAALDYAPGLSAPGLKRRGSRLAGEGASEIARRMFEDMFHGGGGAGGRGGGGANLPGRPRINTTGAIDTLFGAFKFAGSAQEKPDAILRANRLQYETQREILKAIRELENNKGLAAFI